MAGELGVGVNRAGFGQNLSALDIGLVDAAEQGADVVAGLSVIEQFAEHFNAGDNRLAGSVHQADNFNFLRQLKLATLDTAGGNGAAARDGEDVFDRHQEGQIGLALRGRDIAVNSIHQLDDAGISGIRRIGGSAFQSLQGRAADDRDIIARELVSAQQLANFHLNQLEQLFVVNLIAFVQEHNDSGNADLTGQQDVLTGLSHRAVGSSNNQNSAVHLSSTGDHVLDIVSVARAVNVGIVAGIRFILNVGGIDGNAALALFGGFVDGVIGLVLGLALESQHLGDSSGQRSFAVVDVTDGPDVNVGFRSFEFCLGHCSSSLCLTISLLV